MQLFLAPKELPREQGNLVLDCSKFDAKQLQTINRLRALENVESARYLSGDFTIWGEMHRIAQRQFHWQRGYFNNPLKFIVTPTCTRRGNVPTTLDKLTGLKLQT